MTYVEMVNSFNTQIVQLTNERAFFKTMVRSGGRFGEFARYQVVQQDILYYQMLSAACSEMILQERVKRDTSLKNLMYDQLETQLEEGAREVIRGNVIFQEEVK